MSDVLLAVDAGVARVTMNRPDRHNAFDDALIRALLATFDELARRDDVRVVVLAGAGPSFCAGADLQWMRATAQVDEAQNRADALELQRLFATLDGLEKPVVARVQGPAIGGGCGLVACADIVVAGPRARLGLSEVRLGLAPAVISPFVVRKVGSSRARELFLTGDRIDGETARLYGLVHRLVTDEAELDAAVEGVVQSLLKGGPKALAASKELARFADQWEEPAARTSALIARLRTSPEGQEGMRAFFERRPPAWVPPSES